MHCDREAECKIMAEHIEKGKMKLNVVLLRVGSREEALFQICILPKRF